MAQTIDKATLRGMSVEDRLKLLDDVWATLQDAPEVVPLPVWHREELDRRIEAHRADPGKIEPWRDALSDLEARLRP